MNRLHSPPHVVGYWVLYQHKEVGNVCQSNKSVGILYSFDKLARMQWPQAFQPDEPFYEARRDPEMSEYLTNKKLVR
jgi:hypothetical protein